MTGFGALVSEHSDNDSGRQWRGISRVKGPSFLSLPLLTLGLFGISLFWSSEMTQASPYLLSLGVSKSAMSLILMAGPMSGLIVQPIVGVLSDNCTSSWGRRMPYMLLGTGLAMTSMLLMGYTRSFAALFTGWGTSTNEHLSVILGIFSIWMVDFSINAVQAVDRALIVDVLPVALQSSGTAWAAKMGGLGSVAGTFISEVDMTSSLSFLGSKQLQKISCIVSFVLLAVHMIVFFAVQERILLRNTSSRKKSKTVKQELLEIFQNILTLPHTIKQICLVQLFAWIGWFPVLFYSTTFIGDLYIGAQSEIGPHIEEEGTRLGSRALFYHSVVSLAANFILPFFVLDGKSTQHPSNGHTNAEWKPEDANNRLGLFSIPHQFKIHLSVLWALSHALFFVCMMFTFFTGSVEGTSLLIAVSGVSWAVSQWAPYSLLGEAILTHTTADEASPIMLGDARTIDEEREIFLSQDRDEDSSEDEDEPSNTHNHERRLSVMSNPAAARSGGFILNNVPEEVVIPPQNNDGGLSSKAGIILGIHNIFIVIPQFLVTALSTVIFAVTEPEKLAPSETPISNITTADNASRSAALTGATTKSSVAYIFRIGGFSTAVAFFISWRLSKELRRH